MLQGEVILEEGANMASLDWSQCPAVEKIPGKVSGAWVFLDTRMPVSIVFENLEAGTTIDEIIEWFHLAGTDCDRAGIAARASDPFPVPRATSTLDAHPFDHSAPALEVMSSLKRLKAGSLASTGRSNGLRQRARDVPRGPGGPPH